MLLTYISKLYKCCMVLYVVGITYIYIPPQHPFPLTAIYKSDQEKNDTTLAVASNVFNLYKYLLQDLL